MEALPDVLRRAAIPAGVRALLERLQAAGHEAWLVGGGVRDLLLGMQPKDWDIATQALPQEVMRLFRRVVPTGIAHGTVTVLVPEGQVEVTTFRVESAYVDGRRPGAVEFRRDLVEDLARRDFTINALAFDPVGHRFRDPFGGQEDLARRRVRCVGVPADRFAEDGLRPLRAVRFATVLDFELDPETEAAAGGAGEAAPRARRSSGPGDPPPDRAPGPAPARARRSGRRGAKCADGTRATHSRGAARRAARRDGRPGARPGSTPPSGQGGRDGACPARAPTARRGRAVERRGHSPVARP